MGRKVAGFLPFVLSFTLFFAVAQAQDTIKIGVILPLTGPNAVIGQEEKRGVDMAIEPVT